jgi:hypothetical protein
VPLGWHTSCSVDGMVDQAKIVTDAHPEACERPYKSDEGMTMRAADLKLRCYAERDSDGSWFAICIDLNLYARSDSLKAVKKELHSIIREYVREAFGPDRKHFQMLMRRRAPLSFVLKYHYIVFLCNLDKRLPKRRAGTQGHTHLPYDDTLPVVPA